MSGRKPCPVIVHGIRTPFVKAGRELGKLFAHDLGRLAVTELLYQSECPADSVDEVIVGVVSQPAEVSNIARIIGLMSRIPASKPAKTVQMNCASGMQAIINAAEQIILGAASSVVCAAVESVSNIPLKTNQHMSEFYAQFTSKHSLIDKMNVARNFRLDFFQPVVSIAEFLKDGYSGHSMGQTADYLALNWRISREAQDGWALRSHRLAREAYERGYLTEEQFPIFTDPDFTVAVDRDTSIRTTVSMESLQGLRPYYDRDAGTVTRGNMAPLVDGAAAMLVMSEKQARSCGYTPEFRLAGWAYGGLPPDFMGLAPIIAMDKVLTSLSLKLEDIKLFEINEVFAAHILAVLDCLKNPKGYRELRLDLFPPTELDPDIINVNGGALAIGHSLSASSMRIVIHLVREMKRRHIDRGLAVTAVNGGQAVALVVERC